MLSLQSWHVSPSPHAGMFTNLEALQSPYFRVFTEAASLRRDGSLTRSPAPSPSQRVDGGAAESSRLLIMDGLAFQGTSPHPGAAQEPTQSGLIRTKDTPFTQEITRVLGALCQERGAETSVCISCYVTQPVLEVAAEQVPIFLTEAQSVVDPHRTLFAC